MPSRTAAPPIPVPNSPWTAGFGIDPFTAAEIERFSTVSASLDQPPAFLIPIYKAAGREYDIPWQVLAAINAIETNYGQDLAVSPKGAIGWMQFMPGTWMEYAVHVSGDDGPPNPYDPRVAIFAAARLLATNGGARDIRRALFAYNHALWYVDAVLWRAALISDHGLDAHLGKVGYALPLPPPATWLSWAAPTTALTSRTRRTARRSIPSRRGSSPPSPAIPAASARITR
jgi:hypothetical protein